MAAPAAIAGTFADLKFIKSRSVVQIVIETPIENGPAVVAAFGTPQPGSEVAVAVARIKPEAVKPAPERERKWNEVARASQAGIRCNEDAFSRFLAETGQIDGFDNAAEAVRAICDVKTRSDLDKYEHAAVRWDRLDREYRAWLDAPKYGAA